jgi:hypothetical protein
MAEWRGKTRIVRSVAIALTGAMALVACGEMPTPGTEVLPPPPLSPQAGEIPEETSQANATIQDESLKPDRFTGQIGSAFQLVVTGDGAEHTLAIGDLVAGTPIAPEGETTVSFTIGGDPGEVPITLDGAEVGTFEKQSAGGITDS